MVPKLSEMSNLPLLDDIDVSCFWKSGLETPVTLIPDWLALKLAITFSRPFASAPPQRYENVILVGPDVGVLAQPVSAVAVTTRLEMATARRNPCRPVALIFIGVLVSSLTWNHLRIGIPHLAV